MFVVQVDFLAVGVLVKGGKHDDGYGRNNLRLPAIEVDDNMMDGHQYVMRKRLESLLHRKELALIRAGIVHLALARSGSCKVRMGIIGITEDIGGFGYVVVLLIACLAGVDSIDLDVVLLLAGHQGLELTPDDLVAVLGTG